MERKACALMNYHMKTGGNRVVLIRRGEGRRRRGENSDIDRSFVIIIHVEQEET